MTIGDRGRLRHSIGIETGNDTFTLLIRKGTRLPVSLTETFTTADPNQSSIKITPLQGGNRRASLNTRLGLFEVTEIPPAGPGMPQIHVTFHVDTHGVLSITAKDADSGWDLPVLRR